MRFTFLILLLIITLFSCKKSDSFYPPLGKLSVDIDGVSTTFTNCKANITNGLYGSSVVSIEAGTADSISNLNILFQINHGTITSNTTYVNLTPLSTQLHFFYSKEFAPDSYLYFQYNSDITDAPDTHTNITITAIDSTTTTLIGDSIPFTYITAFRGTFNATVNYSISNSNGSNSVQHPLIHTLSNGKFNLPNVW